MPATGSQYVDTGDASVDHALLNNVGEAPVNFTAAGGELGFTSFYFNTRNDVGLTDGDFVGVTNFTGDVGSYPDGTKGFEISDSDGKMTVTLDTVSLVGFSTPAVSIRYFLVDTGWETAPADTFRIWVTVDGGVELDLIDTAGVDIDSLGIEGVWTLLSQDLTGYTTATLRFELDSNAAAEAAYLDDIVFSGVPIPVDPIINELDADTPGTDVLEFIELYDGGVGNTPLDGYVMVFYNGSNDLSYAAFDLDGQTTNGSGYFVMGNTAVANVDLVFAGNLLQNGQDAVALYTADATDFPNNTAVTTTNLVDALVYDTSDADDPGLLVLLNAGQPQVDENSNASGATESNQRCPNGSGGARNTTTYLQAAPSPGAANTCPGVISLSVDDVSLVEGDALTQTMTFTVSLSAPAGVGGVVFDIATADDSATVADFDYDFAQVLGQTITAGNSSFSFDVTINGDTTPEPDESFFVNVTNVTGATVTDGQGVGTITNDDITVTLISAVQGSGASSPLVGNSVTVRGIVTGVKNNGFWVQEEDADADADPLTSEGVFVFTNAAPPAAAVVGNLVQVTATVVEFVPSQDTLQPPLTELSSPSVSLISTGNPLPAAIPLTTTFPDPTGAHDQLEVVEGMRVSVVSLTVVGPTLGSINEANATATSSGVLFGVVTGVARPFREAGIQAPDPAPSGSIPPIPRFDSNPERLRVDTDVFGLPALDAGFGAILTNVDGVLDYGFRTYTINPTAYTDGGGGPMGAAVATPVDTEVTVASFNVQRLFDENADGPGPTLTLAAYNGRLAKLSLAIRNYLGAPDILGIVEIERLSVLQELAAQISADAILAAQTDPLYEAHLFEGNDVGGIDVGFLIRKDLVDGISPRVVANSVTQLNAAEMWNDPSDGLPALLNDRPPLLLDATVTGVSGATTDLHVLLVHQRSLNGINNESVSGSTTVGGRVRAKRQAQAESLAAEIQALQAENLVALGDFNAFEFNDGFVDAMGVVAGTPSPDNETAIPGDGADLVNPDLVNLSAGSYSFVFDGSAQSLDHALVNQSLIAATAARRVEHPRLNADFPETDRNDLSDAFRAADHDPIVVFLEFTGLPVELENFSIE